MNRLRHDDFLNLFLDSGHHVLIDETDIDDSILLDISIIQSKPCKLYQAKDIAKNNLL
jgi:hypothetical protein